MKRLMKKMIVSCSALFALASVAMMSAPAAHAGEFCSVNNSYMRSCSFETMAQCEAMISGRDGTCLRDPFLPGENGAFASVQKRHPPENCRTNNPVIRSAARNPDTALRFLASLQTLITSHAHLSRSSRATARDRHGRGTGCGGRG